MTTSRVPLVVEFTDGGGSVDADLVTDGLEASQLDADVQARLIPAGGSVGQVIKRAASGVEWGDDAEGAPGSGQSAAQVRSIVQSYTGQPSATGKINSDRLPEAGADTVGVVSDLDIRGIAAEEAQNARVDTVMDTSQTYVALGPDVDAGGLGNTLRLAFTARGHNFEIRRMLYDNDDSQWVLTLANFTDAQYALLAGFLFVPQGDIGYPFAYLSDPLNTYASADTTREMRWDARGTTPTTGTHNVKIYEPLTDANFVPGSGMGYLRRTAGGLAFSDPAVVTPLRVDDNGNIVVAHATAQGAGIVDLDDISQYALPPVASKIPDDANTGQTVRIEGVQSYANFYTASAVQNGQIRELDFPDFVLRTGTTGASLQSYSATHGTAALRGKTFLTTGGTGSLTGVNLTLNFDGDDYSVAAASTAGQPHFYEVVGLGYDTLTAEEHTIRFTGEATYPADGEIGVAGQESLISWAGTTWVYAYNNNPDWVSDPSVKIPEGKLPAAASIIVHDGPGNGITIVGGASRRQPLQGFSPSFDLDDADKQRGVFAVSMRIRLASREQTSVGFDTDTTDPELEASFTGFVFASQLRASADYAGNANNGVQVGVVAPVRNGSATIGNLSLRLAHDAGNLSGYYLNYEREGSAAIGYSVVVDGLNIGFIHNDTGPAVVAPAWETLLDYNPASPPAYAVNRMWECPTAFSRALTAADDEDLLDIRIWISDTADPPPTAKQSGQPQWGGPFGIIRVGDWRTAPNQTAPQPGNTIGMGATTTPTYAGGTNRHGGTGWDRLHFLKGPNGRVAFVPLSARSVQRLQVRLRKG